MTEISVAMATFNGSRFIEAQLRSLASQTDLPAELVVVDDGSHDDTLTKVVEFSETAPFPVRIHCNRVRLGYRLNFMVATEHCRSPLIAFCDQDDVWRQDKLQRAKAAFNDPEVMLVHHNAHVVNAAGEGRATLLPQDSYPPSRPAMTGSPWDFPFGFTMVFRAGLTQLNSYQPRSLDPYHEGEVLAHDQWISLLSWVYGKRVYIEEPLADYRIHGANAFGVTDQRRPSRLSRLHLAIEDRSDVYRRLALAADANASILWDISGVTETPAPLRSEAGATVARWSDLARLYRLRAETYTGARLRDRLRALTALVGGGAYGVGGAWSFGYKSLIRDLLLGGLCGPTITALEFPPSDRDASLRALASPAVSERRAAPRPRRRLSALLLDANSRSCLKAPATVLGDIPEARSLT